MFFQLRYRFPVSGSRPSEKDLSADGDVIGKLRCTNPRGGTGGKCGKSENCLSERLKVKKYIVETVNAFYLKT